MSVYYIDPSAATNGTGTAASPFNTWTGVPVGAGNLYYQKRGTSWTGTFPTLTAGTSGNVTYVGAYYNADGTDDTTQAKPILNLGDSLLQVAAYMKIENLDVRNSRVTLAASTPAVYLNGSTDCTVNNCAVTTNLAGIGGSGLSRATVTNNIITAATASGSQLMQGVFINNTTSETNNTVTGNTIYLGTAGTTVRGIYCVTTGTGLFMSNLLVKSNTVSLISGSTPLANNSTSHFGVSVSGAISPEVSYNTVTGLSLGVSISTGCANPWVHHNICNSGASTFYGGIRVTGATGMALVEWNTCRRNYGYGISVDNTNEANITRFNDCSLTQQIGAGISSSLPKGIIYGNTLYKNGGPGISLGGTGNVGDDTGSRVVTGNYLIQNSLDSASTSQVRLAYVNGSRSVIINNLFVGGNGGISEIFSSNVEKSNNIFQSQSQFAISTVPQYVRNSIGGYYDFQGIYRLADVGVQRTSSRPNSWASTKNLLQWSEDFTNPFWTKFGTGTGSAPIITPNYESAPDGSITASRVVFNTGPNTTVNDESVIYCSVGGITNGSTYTSSVWVKGTAGAKVLMRGIAAGNYTAFTLTGSWQRISVAEVAANNIIEIGLRQGTSAVGTVNSSVTVSIWGAQLETGSTATTYVPSREMYQINEVAATNLLKGSDQMALSQWWTPSAVIVGTNVAIAPDGSLTATRLIENTSNGVHNLANISASQVTGTAYTFSVYAKRGAGTRSIAIDQYTGTADIKTVFDLGSGTVVSGSGSITALANGWYRCSQTVTATTTGANIYAAQVFIAAGSLTSYTGDGSSSIYLWGAQLEAGTAATSYVPSSTKLVSRSSAKSYYNKNGLLVYAGNDQAAYDYDPSTVRYENLLPNSDIATGWTYSGGATSFNSVVAPDGTTTASSWTMPASTGNFAYLAQSFTGDASQQLTLSVWLKSPSGSVTASLAISSVSTGSTQTQLITVTPVWQRFSFTVAKGQVIASSNGNLGVGINGSATGQVLHVWGAQLNSGATTLEYSKTTGTAQPKQYMDRGLSIEAAGTNLTAYSQNIENGWQFFQSTGILNSAIAPDGTMTADKLMNNGASEQSLKGPMYSFVIGNTYTASVYAKAGEVSTFQLAISSTVTGTGSNGNYDLVAGTATSNGPCSATIKAVGNGWYRCSVTFSAYYSTSANSVWINLAMASADTTKGMYFWGMQLEAVSVTSYGAEQISNGSFASGSTGWTVGNGWSVSGGVATKGSSTSGSLTSTGSSIVGGHTYQVTFTATGVTSNNFKVVVNNPGDNFQSDYFGVNGTNTFTFTATTSGQFSLFDFSSGVTVTNISVKEMIVNGPTSYMPSSLTFTSRGSTGTYFDLNGVMQTAAANVARMTYEPSNLSAQPCLLLEPAATNLALYSTDLTNAAWNVRWGGTGTVVADTTYLGPDNSGAYKATASAGGAGLGQAVSLTAGQTYTFSCWVVSPSAGVNVGFSTSSTGFGGANSVAVSAGTKLTRVSVTYTAASTATYYVGVAHTVALQTCYVWGCQLETGSVATSYIATTSAAVTRSADVYTSSTGSRAADVVTSLTATRATDVPTVRNNIYSLDIPVLTGDMTTKDVPYPYGSPGTLVTVPAPVAISMVPYNGDVVADPKLDPVTYAPLAGSPLLDTSWRDGIRMFTVPFATSDA